jgi:hypothetical protein
MLGAISPLPHTPARSGAFSSTRNKCVANKISSFPTVCDVTYIEIITLLK